ncbi:MAG: ABC transporter permease [Rhodospirillales bacterium]|nr:ABC transporter permease [Rhodospirillales bacterium]
MSHDGLFASVLRIALPIVLAFAAGAVILLALGKNPLDYYAFVFRRGLLSWAGFQETITRSAPLLMIAAGLIVAFRAGIWNLGVDGQFLLAAVVCSALAPWLIGFLPRWLTLVSCLLAAALVGASWSLIPALLKARYGVNEIITTLMMSFLGISLANVLIKAVFWDPTTTVPQTPTLPVPFRLPRLFDTTIHFGIVIAAAAILLVHFIMTRTAFGLKLRIVGANPRAAVHAGLPMASLTFATFALSAALIGMGGAIEILGVWGTVRADWNPSYGLLVIPLVFLARFNGLGSIVFVLFFAALQIGGESAARRLDVPHYYVLLLVSLVLLFLAIVEYLDHLSSRRRAAA